MDDIIVPHPRREALLRQLGQNSDAAPAAAPGSPAEQVINRPHQNQVSLQAKLVTAARDCNATRIGNYHIAGIAKIFVSTKSKKEAT